MMDLELQNKSVIVTGAGSNIGRAITLGFAREGAKITLAANSHDGVARILPPDFVPKATSADVALCNDGAYSANTDFAKTCSNGDGVSRWLSVYAECADGTRIALAERSKRFSSPLRTSRTRTLPIPGISAS